MIRRLLLLIPPSLLLAGCQPPPPPEPLIDQNTYVQPIPTVDPAEDPATE